MMAVLAVHSTNGRVQMSGELDLTTGVLAFDACCGCAGVAVELDVAELTFLDSRGYSALVDAARVLESQGRTLTISGIRGAPLRLVNLIAAQYDRELVHTSSERAVRSLA
jgi:ABC-type transporter Mla MlaB component